MTDFFADLEQELRGAHPRRPKPVVPVRAIAVTASVLVAVAVALATLAPSGEREVATPSPPPPAEGWTEYAPLNCVQASGRVVDGTIPDEIVDRFAILRGDDEHTTMPDELVPPDVAEVVRQSVRPLVGPQNTKYAFLVGRLVDDRCRPGKLAICLVSIGSKDGVCSVAGEGRVEESFVREMRDGQKIAAVLAEDGIPSVKLGAGGPEVEVQRNVGFELVNGVSEEVTPLNCAGQPEMGELERRFAIFRKPPARDTNGIELSLPQGYHTVYLQEARRAGELVVVPVGDARCATGVCLVRMGSEKTACQMLQSDGKAVALSLSGEGRFAALIKDGVRNVTVATSKEEQELVVEGNIVDGPVSGEVLEVYLGS